ncbi:MAG TPA: TonB-dependent receptor [Pyrinomonadaceae bacterium]|nr:TonB-dependent receptor [Pyrinomonadaceae bacterium]
MRHNVALTPRRLLAAALLAAFAAGAARAQDTVTGAFEGIVRDKVTRAGISGAYVEITDEATDVVKTAKTDTLGYFFSGALPPGTYTVRVASQGYESATVTSNELLIAKTTPVVPRPVEMEKLSAGLPRPRRRLAAAPPAGVLTRTLFFFLTPAGLQAAGGGPAQTPANAPRSPQPVRGGETIFKGNLYATDARLDGSFRRLEIESLPLGGQTLTRTFDELAFLLPGVAPPPETVGGGAGPGVGAGVGSAGQFAVNGLRSRANNFTVDGSDNNDEDIGVRRQGFLALVPQPVESIQEYQVITLLAPAQFGRNVGAQVNAVSRSGGRETHGALFGLFNSSRLDARNYFDTANGSGTVEVRSGAQRVVAAPAVQFNLDTFNFDPVGGSPVVSRNGSGGKDSSTLGQGGFVLGGAIRPRRLFYFVSAERQVLNASREESFAVPTVAERGAFGAGASGLFANPFTGASVFAFPTTAGGDAVFSLFPFPNNPDGVYGAHTYTQGLPAGARGLILSGRLDANFREGARQHALAGRYNFTDDWRDIPAPGGALFSTLRPRVRTQNLSLFLNSRAAVPDPALSVFNQLRLSYGRTRLRFDEVRDKAHLIPSRLFPGEPFLLNAPLLSNVTLPDLPPAGDAAVANAGDVVYLSGGTVEESLGPLGRVNVAGYSPVGVDVFNFPQRRVNNTYQFADHLTLRRARHTFAPGIDVRRTELRSVLPRNFRPLLSFNGAPRLAGSTGGLSITDDFVRPVDLAAASAASGFFQTLTTGSDSGIDLRYYQLDFYAQDEWRARPNLSLSAGLRYEVNTTPREASRSIEETFDDPALALAPGLGGFVEGRTKIYETGGVLAPRVGVAYAPGLFGGGDAAVVRAGYGLYSDQVLGAVVSQSRSVYPTFLNVNTAGGLANPLFFSGTPVALGLLNPADSNLVLGGTLNTLGLPLAAAVAEVNAIASAGGAMPGASGVEVTVPARRLLPPLAHQYALSFEGRLGAGALVSAAYVGTRGRRLLRFATPNLGSNAVVLVNRFEAEVVGPRPFEPQFYGIAVAPGTRLTAGGQFAGGRPVPGVGGVSMFETAARSRYDAFQLQLRGRALDSLQYLFNYTFSEATDDVSDVFELAGASALPQNSLTFAGEYGPANYDARHLASYYVVYDLGGFGGEAARRLFGGLRLVSAGRFRTGQPFTVNSLFDVNLDGNLTDRLDATSGLLVTGDRRRPLLLTTSDLASLRARAGEDGRVGRNTFRAGNVFVLDAALIKSVRLGEAQLLLLRAEVFNLTNRANFGVPVRLLEAPGFGRATSTVTPARRVQFSLKYEFE